MLGDRRTGHFIVMIYKMILLDIVPFSIVTLVFLVGFAHVIFLLGSDKSAYTFFSMIGGLFEVTPPSRRRRPAPPRPTLHPRWQREGV